MKRPACRVVRPLPRRRVASFGVVAVFLFVSVAASCASAPSGAPPASAAVRGALRPFIAEREVAGAVTIVATGDAVLHEEAVGWADAEEKRRMRTDSIFWIASMTKPITATAVLMLEEAGKLSVDDPIAKHLPAFAKLARADGKPVVVTIRHLLTHTSGMAEATREESRGAATLAEIVPFYVARPVRFEPGTEWAYCQSGINTAARIVEVASGMSFVDFLERRIFTPLGMVDTTFYLREEQLPRLAASYRRTDEGELERAPIRLLHGKPPTSRDRYPAANGGLFSTARDYLSFCRMILAGGTFGAKRLLSEESVTRMTTIHTGELQTGFTPGNGWGLGWCVVREPQGVTEMLSAGTHGHGGAYGTQAWIDPHAGRIDILMVQRANFPNSDASDLRRAFEAAAAALRSGGGA